MSEVNYELQHPFDYSHKGDMVKAGFIELKAPSFKQMQYVAPIKQSFMNAMTSIGGNFTEEEKQEAKNDTETSIDAQGVMHVLYSSDEDMKKVFLHAEQLFKSGTALVEGETLLTTPLMEKMRFDDYERLVGTYIANFITPSLMDG